jgi:hypothetical protein
MFNRPPESFNEDVTDGSSFAIQAVLDMLFIKVCHPFLTGKLTARSEYTISGFSYSLVACQRTDRVASDSKLLEIP